MLSFIRDLFFVSILAMGWTVGFVHAQEAPPEQPIQSVPYKELIKALCQSFSATNEASATTEAGNGVQQCWSAKKCTGKVLNNRDYHNCCNSGGKSWSDRWGNCYPC